MDLLQNLLKEKGGDLVGALTGSAGFGKPEAERFVPAAGSSMLDAFKSQAGSLDLDDIQNAAKIGAVRGAETVDKIMQGIDIGGLAKQVGITPEQSAKGLAAIMPMVLGFMKEHGDSLSGLLGMLGGGADGPDVGDALGKLKGLGKMFGR